jgi:hypothetical protein
MTDIRPAELPKDLDKVRDLFREYAESLNVDLAFPNFEAELASLPANTNRRKGGSYSPGAAQWRSAALRCAAWERLPAK